MIEVRTYKYRLKDRRAARLLRAHTFQCNQIWNWCVAQHRDTLDRYKAGAKPRRWLSHYDLSKTFTGYSKEIGLHQQTIGSICEQWVRNRSTRFRASYGAKRALGWIPFQKQSRQVEGNSIWYPGKRYRWFGDKRRPLPINAKGGYFIEDSLGRWYVCFHVEAESKQPDTNNKIGTDLGLKSFAALSDGYKIEAPHIYRRYEERLAIAQRAHNKQRVRRLHAKIANCRRDFLHKLSTDLAARYALIAVGNVNAKQLAKTRMAKSVLDAGWSSFRAMLQYKSADYVEVDEKFTTQTCAECGSIAGPKGQAGLNKREWFCDDCGASHDRDVNSAIVILARASSAQGLGQESRMAA
jgi:IS605 OrfB family transposase